MGGLAKICKIYGSMQASDKNGKKVIWLWDFVNDKPRLKTEMSRDEIIASEKAKWAAVKSQLDAEKFGRTTQEKGKCLHNVGSQDVDGYFRCLYCGVVVEDVANYR